MALRIASGKILFGTVMAAITKAGASIVNNEKDKESCPIVWYDTLHEQDHDMQGIKPWQMVNRLPGINYICRKAPLFRLLNRMAVKLPSVYNFFPRSYIVPQEYQQFVEDRKSSNKKYIYKPDNGSLGNGIVILKPETKFNYQKSSAVIQEFVESALINNTKFDLRIYALVASIHPLRIYVYRDGIARFCSAPNSNDTQFGQITNTAVNRKNPNHVSIEQITKTVSETFSELSHFTNIDVLWEKIDRIIVLSVISSLKILRLSEMKYCPAHLFQQCFQLLGFDILIDKNYEPKILEVNYRPSLAADIAKESSLKIDMLSTLIKIMSPPEEHIVKLSTMSEEQLNNAFNKKSVHPDIIQDIVREGRSLNNYICVYPTNNKERMTEYKLAMTVVSKMSGSIDSRGNIPFMDVSEQVNEVNEQQQKHEEIKEKIVESRKLSARESQGNVSARKSLNNISLQKKTEIRSTVLGESVSLKKTPMIKSNSREKDLSLTKHQRITIPSSHYTSRIPIHRTTHLLPK